MDEVETLDAFEDQVAALGRTLGGTGAMVAAFEAEMTRMRGSFGGASRDVAALSRSLSRGLRDAMDGVVFEGDGLSAALRSIAQSMANATYAAAVKPVTDRVGGLLAAGVEGLIGAASGLGAGFAEARVTPFARGGVVSTRRNAAVAHRRAPRLL